MKLFKRWYSAICLAIAVFASKAQEVAAASEVAIVPPLEVIAVANFAVLVASVSGKGSSSPRINRSHSPPDDGSRASADPMLLVDPSRSHLIVAAAILAAASPRWEPQIAVLCEAGQVYQPQYLSEEGRWVTDLNKKSSGSTCLRDKLDLLDYCKKPDRRRERLVSLPEAKCLSVDLFDQL
uniref:E1 domain-containing protein n=1 Tax=Glossina pallidipes TaxID=7398 RepID=A0A1B0AK31_GLOPL